MSTERGTAVLMHLIKLQLTPVELSVMREALRSMIDRYSDRHMGYLRKQSAEHEARASAAEWLLEVLSQ